MRLQPPASAHRTWPTTPQAASPPLELAAWRTKPTWYQVSRQDRTIDPDLERFLAHRMGANTIELDTSHLSLITEPRSVAALILAAAGRS